VSNQNVFLWGVGAKADLDARYDLCLILKIIL